MSIDFEIGKISRHVKTLLESNIPYQFVAYTGLPIIKRLCKEFHLPKPTLFGGNIVIGNLQTCNFLLTAHLDEISFGLKRLEKDGGYLAPYYKYISIKEKKKLSILGVRHEDIITLGKGILVEREDQPFCETNVELQIGDRIVYHYPPEISGNLVTGKAIDDRIGSLIILLVLSGLLSENFPVAAVLSDGETGMPKGYFSRNFPHILPILKSDCMICFIDGLYKDDLESFGYIGPPKETLIVPHSSYGKGYVVPPLVFGWLRDVMIPMAQREGIAVKLCEAYRSRGDEWGMVTNPITGNDFDCLFVDFGTWGGAAQEIPLTVDITVVKNCVRFITLALENWLRK